MLEYIYISNLEYAPKSEKLTYAEAVLYCQFLEHGGHTDWRMPTGYEFERDIEIGAFSWYVNLEEAPGSSYRYYGAVRRVYPVRDVC